ncbi:MAG: hypothetical protein ACFE0O_11470 [Opitutales bacterium]
MQTTSRAPASFVLRAASATRATLPKITPATNIENQEAEIDDQRPEQDAVPEVSGAGIQKMTEFILIQ